MTPVDAPGVGSPRTLYTSGRLGWWAAVALVPMAAYALPLWRNALADTPIAYLVWIPLLAALWAVWNMATVAEPYPDDKELNVLLGGAAALLVGTVLAFGPERWPATLVYEQVGILLWPLWALALAWLLFGLGVTRRLLAPLAYWLLAWPPVFGAVADRTQSVLVTWAVAALRVLARWAPWIRPGGADGMFWVAHAGHWAAVVVGQACSGADSLLGAAILLPLVLTLWRGPGRSSAVLATFALAGAVGLNWFRLIVLVAALHIAGPGFTFGMLHPVLGFLLFALLGGVLAAVAPRLGLSVRPGPRIPALALPGRRRLALASGLGSALFLALWPLFRLPPGNAGNPVPVASDRLDALLPALADFSRTTVYRADESAVLGPDSTTVAEVYRAATGAQALVEVWSTPNAATLASYGFRDCLLYHGDTVLAQTSFVLPSGLVATAYAVGLAPGRVGGPRPEYVDVEWNSAVKTPAGVRYLRWSVAAFPTPSRAWPTAVTVADRGQAVAGIRALGAPPDAGVWPNQLTPTAELLRRLAGILAGGTASGLRPS
jgi:exosortase/archaeosortase family protein